MLKFMEHWDYTALEDYTPVSGCTYGYLHFFYLLMLTPRNFFQGFIMNARRQYVLEWVTHPKNEMRDSVLHSTSVSNILS